MAKQPFSREEREAIWRAYGGMCPYTGRWLEADNFHIDHILPESLRDNPSQLAKILSQFNLPLSFDLTGYENLVPSHPAANRQKGDQIFKIPHGHYYLNLAASKKPNIEQQLNQIKRRQALRLARLYSQQPTERSNQNTDVDKKLSRSGDSSQIFFQAQLANVMKVVGNVTDRGLAYEAANRALDDIKRAGVLLGYV